MSLLNLGVTGNAPLKILKQNLHVSSTPGHGGQADSKPAGQRSIRWVCAIVPSSSGQRHSVVSGEIAGSNPVGTDL